MAAAQPPISDPRTALSPEQLQILQIVLSDPIILSALAAELTGASGGANPQLAQAGVTASQGVPSGGPTPDQQAMERQLLLGR